MKKLAVVAATVALMIPSAAWADWQYTRWGMTPAQVVTASRGGVHVVQGDPGESVFDQTYGGIGDYTAVGVAFEARFFFSPLSGGLSLIRLEPKNNAACDSLAGELAGIYGSADHSQGRYSSYSEWVDANLNLSIRFSIIDAVGRSPRQCFVLYRPLRPETRPGL